MTKPILNPQDRKRGPKGSRRAYRGGRYIRPLAMAQDVAKHSGTLDPVRPSAALSTQYDRRLRAVITEMQKDVVAALEAAWRGNPPKVAMLYAADASPASTMQSAFTALARGWTKRFEDLSENLALWFSTEARDRSQRTLAANLRKGGMTVRFKMTAAMNDAFQAVRQENVGLIRSIASEYFGQIETLVMQSVSQGRDLATLAQGLQKRFGITKRRAAFIAIDQNNKATAVFTRVRYLEMGIKKAIWLHSAGGKEPRPSHVAFSGRQFDLAKGVVLDPKEGVVWPGTAIRCRCVPKPVIPGFED